VRPYLEKTLYPPKKGVWGAGGVAQGVGPEFNPSTTKKNKKKKVYKRNRVIPNIYFWDCFVCGKP
jgi:hypothetical protein